jgi:chromosome segregation ATPase
VLYLAEVQKQKTGFMGSAKAELKLLACQRADLSWNPLPREELIPATTEETNNLNDGVLVLVDLNPQRQVQRLQEAGRPLVSILQNFSRQLEKSKSQEEEISQWKQSLTYQSQELNSRQMEMEARWEQMQQMEEDFERLEAQRQEINTAQEETQRLRAEIERKRQELEGAWEHLLGEQRRLEERQTTGWDEDRTRQLQELIAGAESGVTPAKALLLELELAFEMIATQQGLLNQHWQQLDGQRGSTHQQQEEVDSLAQGLQNRLREWQQAQTSLEQTKSELQAQTSVLIVKQEQVQRLSVQLRNYEELYQQIYGMVERSSSDEASQKVDVSALEEMPLDQLQQLVQSYTQIMEKASRFVNEQEEELSFLHETITELQAKLQQAVDRDRQHLEMELAEEQDHYQMLNETLVGQRQNLQEREEILNQHRRVLLRREGNSVAQGQEEQIDLKPLLAQVARYKQQQSGELQELERQIEQLRFDIQQALEMVDRQSQEQETQWQELQSLEQNLLSLRTSTAESWGRVNLYQEMLQPVQDSLDGLRHRLETLTSTLARVEETSNEQLQTITQMRQTLEL